MHPKSNWWWAVAYGLLAVASLVMLIPRAIAAGDVPALVIGVALAGVLAWTATTLWRRR